MATKIFINYSKHNLSLFSITLIEAKQQKNVPITSKTRISTKANEAYKENLLFTLLIKFIKFCIFPSFTHKNPIIPKTIRSKSKKININMRFDLDKQIAKGIVNKGIIVSSSDNKAKTINI